MSQDWSHLPLFYLLAEDDWPKSRRGSSFLAVMRDAAQRRFRDLGWKGLASTYRFKTPLPATNTAEPDDQAEVTRILEWHHPSVHIDRHHVDDKDEDTPSGALVRYWTVYDLDDACWHRARDIETRCRARSDDHLREFDGLLDAFAKAALDGTVATFTLNERDRTKLPIGREFWDEEVPVLRALHAHGRYDPDNASSLRPRGREAIYVEETGLKTWLDGIKPIPSNAIPERDLACAFLDDLENELKRSAHDLRKRKRIEDGDIGLPGGKSAISAILKGHPFNLPSEICDTLIAERLSQVFIKPGRPGGVKTTGPILEELKVKYKSLV